MKRPVHDHKFTELVYTLKPLLRRYPPLSKMYVGDMADWLTWYWNRGTMTWHMSEDGEADGVCLVRLFRYLDQFVESDAHDPCGKFCFIECAIALEPSIMGLMLESLTHAWGPQETMLWDRSARTENGAPRMYKWEAFMKLATRLSQTKVRVQ
jgi:hypothetical protein